MNNQLKEMLLGICVPIVGFNLIGLGVIANGGNYRGNPIWSLIQGFWRIQETAIYAILGGCVLISIIKIWLAKDVGIHVEESNPAQPLMEVAVPKPRKPKEKTAFVEPPAIIPKPDPPHPPPPTAAELKRKALRQITGKEF